MRCEQVRTLLYDYLDGTLSRAVAESVSAHLNTCAECAREHRFLKGIWQEMNRLPEPPVPDDLHARIMTHVRAHVRAREAQRPIVLWRWVAVGVVAASLLLVAFFTTQSPRGVEAGFGVGSAKPEVEQVRPVPAGVGFEWRRLPNGEVVPILLASLNRSATATLLLAETPNSAYPQARPIWRGTLQPGKTLEIPLPILQQTPSERVLTLWWDVEGQQRLLFVPVGNPPAQVASLRLNAPLSEALATLAGTYQVLIEWAPKRGEPVPMVVLDVQSARIEQALSQLLEGTGYQAKMTEHGWRVLPK